MLATIDTGAGGAVVATAAAAVAATADTAVTVLLVVVCNHRFIPVHIEPLVKRSKEKKNFTYRPRDGLRLLGLYVRSSFCVVGSV